MPYVYKYTDISDNIVKYIGIVWKTGRKLEDRVYQHFVDDDWARDGTFRIEYIKVDTRTDAEFIESHLISCYATYNYYNSAKSDWGLSAFINKDAFEWKEFKNNIHSTSWNKKETLENKELDVPICLIERIKQLESDREKYEYPPLKQMSHYERGVFQAGHMSAILGLIRDCRLGKINFNNR